MSARPVPFLTPEEYLEIERKAETKSEYVNGVVYAMAGGSLTHSLIATNLHGELRSALKAKPCRVFNSLYAYPDAMVLCGPAQFVDNRNDTVANPTVIFEILSPSTEAFDRGGKFAH